MKKLLFACTLIACFSVSAQTDLYTAIKENGLDTKYKEYSAFLNEDGTCRLTSYVKDKLVIEMQEITSGEDVGFSLLWEKEPTNGGRFRAGENVLGDYGRAPNYPDVSYIYHSYRKDGYVVIDGNIFKLLDISEDGLSFRNLDFVYMPLATEAKAETKTNAKGKKKKKSFKERMKALKEAYTDLAGDNSSISKEGRELQKVNVKEKILTYLKEMKAKHDKHSSSSEVIKSKANIKNARENKDAYIKAYNDSIKATPEYQRALEARNRREGKQSSGGTYTIKNTSGRDVKVGNGTGSSYHLNSGSSYKVDCGDAIYIMKLNSTKTTLKADRLISNGENVCGKTITI